MLSKKNTYSQIIGKKKIIIKGKEHQEKNDQILILQLQKENIEIGNHNIKISVDNKLRLFIRFKLLCIMEQQKYALVANNNFLKS